MSLVVPIVVVFLIGCASVAVYLWSRWADREAAYDPEPLSVAEGSLYRLGIALGAFHGFRGL